MLIHLVTLQIFTSFTLAAFHPAKRVTSYALGQLSIQDICGSGASDCGGGWCCIGGQVCSPPPSNPSEPYQCQDLLYPSLTVPAHPYSSLLSLVNFDYLTSIGLTISTLPVTMTSGNIFSTGLPSYSDNIVSTITPTVGASNTRGTEKATTSSTGGASMPTGVAGVGLGVWAGGVVGIGMLVGG